MNRWIPLGLLACALLACSDDTPSSTGNPTNSGLNVGGAGSGGSAQAGKGGSAQAGSAQAGSAQAGSAQAGGASGKGGTGGSSAGGAGSGGAAGATAGAGGEAGASAGAGGEGGSEGPWAECAKPPKEGEFYALSAATIEQTDPIPMCRYRGKVVMVVNVASKCGYTPQYAPLEQLYTEYKDKGFVVLGFPCNQFGKQEPGTDEQINDFCQETYGVDFPMFSKIEVNGASEHPIYTWLKAQPGGSGDIPWNFTKFLLGRDGKLVERIASATSPAAPEVIELIEAELAKAPPP